MNLHGRIFDIIAVLVLTLGGAAHADAGANVVGFLGIADQPSHTADVAALRRGLADLGYVDGQTIVIEERYADGGMERLQVLLGDLLAGDASVVVVPGLAAALAVLRRAPDMPVVAVGLPSTVVYPDLFASLQRPGGSVTGFSHFGEDLAVKRVELLRETIPGLSTVAILHNSADPLYRAWGEKTEDAAIQQGLKTVRIGLESADVPDLTVALESAAGRGAAALIVVRDFMTHTLRNDIVRVANVLNMPVMSEQRVFVEAGGLMSYGASFPDLFRRAATYVDAILRGSSPSEMPIQLATEFELVVNLTTAEQLGIAIPPSILLRANQLIH
jgi:putative ABC transport system substrate-binding protein